MLVFHIEYLLQLTDFYSTTSLSDVAFQQFLKSLEIHNLTGFCSTEASMAQLLLTAAVNYFHPL